MIASREVRLVRVPHLRAAHEALAWLAFAGEPLAASRRVILVPTSHAARELRRTLEHRRLVAPTADAAALAALLGVQAPAARCTTVVLPALLARDGFHDELHRRLGAAAAPWLSRAEREAMAWRASDDAIASGARPPFAVRPGLLVEMLGLYDGLRRNGRTVDDFERLFVERLEPGAEIDRGALRLLEQTRYLVAVFRGYERLLAASGALDEHVLRRSALADGLETPIDHVVITVADQAAERDGLWPADFDLLTRLPGLARIDVVATDAVLDAGVRPRLDEWLPGLTECAWPQDVGGRPSLLAPARAEARRFFLSRDREEELLGIARHVRAEAASAPIEETLVVYERPLPYVYLARRVFDDARIPCTIADALPLAAEPYAAALDLVLEAALSGLARGPLIRLLESPLLTWRADGRPLASRDVVGLGNWLRDRGFSAGPADLARCADAFASSAQPSGPTRVRLDRAIRAACAAAEELAALDREQPLTAHLYALSTLLRTRECHAPRHRRAQESPDVLYLRARSATLGLLEELASAHDCHADRIVSLGDVALLVRRAIGDHTFTPVTGAAGVRLVDARSARYAEASTVWLVGVVEGEWPAPSRRSIFYPGFMLTDLGFPREQDRLAGARAAFRDLAALARDRVAVSAFQLEEDAIVRPSVLLEEVEDLWDGGAVSPLSVTEMAASAAQLMRAGATVVSDLAPAAAAWLDLRGRRAQAADPRFHGQAGAPPDTIPSVTEIERYLDCPFKYFASSVLHLEEEDDRDEIGLDPRQRGTLVHDVFQAFFEAWIAAGHGAVTAALLPAARRMFADVVERALQPLPPADRVIERTRLLGSAASAGLGERVFRLEARRPLPVLERLLEFNLGGTYTFEVNAPRVVTLRGKADRIDLLADGTLRLIDYKTGKAPNPRRSVQLAVYALCAEQKLDGHRGRHWRVAEAAYIALAGRHPWVGVMRDAGHRAPLDQGCARFLDALDGIVRGAFPPAPAERRLCASCAFAAVCRKDYVGEPA